MICSVCFPLRTIAKVLSSLILQLMEQAPSAVVVLVHWLIPLLMVIPLLTSFEVTFDSESSVNLVIPKSYLEVLLHVCFTTMLDCSKVMRLTRNGKVFCTCRNWVFVSKKCFQSYIVVTRCKSARPCMNRCAVFRQIVSIASSSQSKTEII